MAIANLVHERERERERAEGRGERREGGRRGETERRSGREAVRQEEAAESGCRRKRVRSEQGIGEWMGSREGGGKREK